MKGKLRNDTDKAGLIEFINKLNLSKVFYWEIKKHIRRRSISANNLYWLRLACISEETGQDIYALHEAFKQMFLAPVIVIINYKEISTYSTKRLNTSQFYDYMEKVSAEVAELGIILPSPEDLIFDSFVEQYENRL